jgi:hypothetical protein
VLRANGPLVMATAAVVALLRGSAALPAQATVDLENRYPNVGTIMFWRVDDSGKPLQLLGFASGTLIRDRVMVTAGHVTGPATALGGMPASVRSFVSFSPTNAKDPRTWIPVVRQATHPSMPRCPPPPKCDPTDDILVAPLQPGIADVGLVFLEHAPKGIKPARFTTTPSSRVAPLDASTWDGKRRIRTSALRRVVDETWALWSIPSHVCFGDSGGAIFLNVSPDRRSDEDELVANVSDGGRDCRRQNNNNRLDTPSIQDWINDTVK